MIRGEQLTPSQRRILWALIIVQAAAIFFFVAQVAPGIVESRWVQDDAYISFRYARNLVEGKGLVYNTGERVEGYTNFLWTVLSAIPLALGAEDPLKVMHGVGLGLWFGTYAILLILGLAHTNRAFLVAPLAAIPLLAHWSFNQWFLSGMETGLVSFLSLLTLLVLSFQDLQRPVFAALLSLVATLLLLSRPDTVFFLAGIALAGTFCEWRWAGKLFFWRRWLPALLAPLILIYVPYTAWRLLYYGDFLPNTYYAKMAFAPMWNQGQIYLQTYFEIYDFLPMLIIPVIATVMTTGAAVRRFLAGAILGSCGVFVYVWRLGGDFMEWRFLMPVTGVLYSAIGVGAFVVGHRCFELLTRLSFKGGKLSGRLAASVCMVTGLAFSVTVLGVLYQKTIAGEIPVQGRVVTGQETIPSLSKYASFNYAWQEVGAACHVILPEDATIATTAAGMIPFFARRATLDRHGLTNREIGRRPMGPNEERGRLGHERTLNDQDVMRRLGVDVIIPAGLPLNNVPHTWSLTRTTNISSAAVPLSGDRFFEIIVLNPDSAIGKQLKKSDRVIFAGQTNLVPKDRLVVHSALLKSQKVVDRLDLQVESSEKEHRFFEIADPEVQLEEEFHEKVLAYLLPTTPLTKRNQGDRVKFHPIVWATDGDSSEGEPTAFLGDEGKILPHEAHWWISGVTADRDLTIVARHDRCAFSQYRVYVNGQRVPNTLSVLRSKESWGEVSVIIPREFLLDGENDIGLVRDGGRREMAGLYYFWFLQKFD